MIERQNVIKILSDRSNVYHSALLTTYSFDPIFFESIYLTALRKLGITNIVILMDAYMYDQLLADTNYQCHRVTQNNYTLVRQENVHSGVFHPKMVMLFGEEEGALVLGSGNLTYSGLSNNEEIWSVFHVLGSESIHYPLFYKAWEYLTNVTSSVSPLIQRQIDWILEQCSWLRKESKDEKIVLQSGEECQLLYNSANSTILNTVFTTIGDKIIDEITVIAPFYDAEGCALKELQRHFSPRIMNCVLDLERQSAPYSLIDDDTTIVYHKSTSSNPLHAKIIEIRGKNETWILCGSANAGNMALGINASVFNDEACILLHSKKKRNYLKELGITFEPLNSKEKESIVRPKQENAEKKSSLLVKLISCEEKEEELILRFNKSCVEGELTILDVEQNVRFCIDITTEEATSIAIGDADLRTLHIAVLRKDNIEISNRVLIIREVNVERLNPDPKRRKLSTLLDDEDLLENLNHILGYIEFDETEKRIVNARITKTSANNNTDDDIAVTRDRFNELKDSVLSINMHPGVRILAYLQQVLFHREIDTQTDDELLALDEENVNKDVKADERERDKIQSSADNASKMHSDIFNFLKKMNDFLIEKTKDQSIYGEIRPAVNRPKLMASPGLNAASSLAVASRAVICMMNKYGSCVTKREDVKDMLVKNAGLFISIYSNKLPYDDTIKNRKILEILKDATVDLLSALCFFSFHNDDFSMSQLILNSLEMWKTRNEHNNIIPLVEEQLRKLNHNSINDRTVNKLRHIADVYLSQETPIEEFFIYCPIVYQLRKGYGFLIVDSIQRTNKGWCCTYHSPWFVDKIGNISSSKYRGYPSTTIDSIT